MLKPLHSTVVLLKVDVEGLQKDVQEAALHSTVVLLKELSCTMQTATQ